MRSLLNVSLVAAAISIAGVLAHAPHSDQGVPITRRKTLGFGPNHPRAGFRSNPEQVPTSFLAPESQDPFNVAATFVESILGDQIAEGSSFLIRKDSYTDDVTGVSHVYFRQTINGFEVSDGDINVNVKDGVVLSYGDSFYRGPVPEPFTSPSGNAWLSLADRCRSWVDGSHEVRTRVLPFMGQDTQVVLGQDHQSPDVPTADCSDAAEQWELNANAISEPSHAVLKFMIAASPNQSLARDIEHNFHKYVDGIETTYEHNVVGDHQEIVEFLHNVPDTVNPVKAKIAYAQIPDGDTTKLSLVWKIEVEMQDNWYEAALTAHDPHTIISVVDWASDSPMIAPIPKKPAGPATYNVFAWGINDPAEGGRSMQKELHDTLASPIGWHAIPAANDPNSQNKRFKDSNQVINYTTTWGNNVFAHENWEGRNSWQENYRPEAGNDMVFDFAYKPSKTDSTDALAEAKKYINTTITQLFYTTNLVHDLFYRYGFDEKSGNFQQHNFGRGGAENDAVIANAQDGSGYNNANFMTPPDGQNGRCRMYLWNTANPYRDGDLEAGIVIHELAHGLSTRLTGGPANSGCLGWGESGGMGEGWGDFLATTIRSTSNYSDYAMGAWAANRPTGIRNFVYSLDESVNPSTYKTLDKPGYWGVHAIGEVWAEILWVVSQRLIAKHGFSDSLFPPAPLEDGTIPEGDFYRPAEYTAAGAKKPLVPKHGNSLMTQLVINGMKLQQCRPSFFDARDAIIQADEILTGGENFCDLWLGFSKRGLGPDARVDGRTPWGGGIRTDGFKPPVRCRGDEPDVPEPGPGDDDEDF